MAKPSPMRTIGLPVDSRITVGRAHQPGFFEGILGVEAAQRYLCCVSRSHLEIALAVDDDLGGFAVTNCSSNPVALTGQRRMGKGEAGMIRTGGSIDFLGENIPGASGLNVFLTLRLEEQGGSDIQVEVEPERSPISRYRAPQTSSFSQVQHPFAAESGTSSGAHPPAASDRMVPYRQQEKQLHAQLPAPSEKTQDSARSGEASHFWLTLCGSVVKEGYPFDARRLEGGEEGLSVGRAHQKELHLEAFDVEMRQYLSRDHFRIDPGIDGSYKLVAISNNPIWRNRCGKRTEAVVGDPPLTLINGDAIQLFTGADDCTATGPGNLGSLLWIFQAATSNKGPTEQDVSVLAKKAAGQSQDFHDSDSGPRTVAMGLDQDAANAKSVAKTSATPRNGLHAAGASQIGAESPCSKEYYGHADVLPLPRSPLSNDRPTGQAQTAGGVLRAPFDDAPPPLSGQPGPLRVPVQHLCLDDDDDDDLRQRNAHEMELDFRDVDDAFAASGFRF